MIEDNFLDELMSDDIPDTKEKEIIPGMTVEEMAATFFDYNALKEPPYRLFQLNGDGQRYYYRYDEDGNPQFYPSVTTLLKQVMPTSPYLIEWMVKNGESATEKRDLAAAYGTFMHAEFEILIINRLYNFNEVPERLLKYIEQNNLPERFFAENIKKIQKDICSFAQFVSDYEVVPLAVEIALVHPTYNYAGMLDLPCMMTDKKTGERFSAIVDFKSGRKGFYEDHELQLHLYKMMWNENFPEKPIERVFNFAPKDWRGTKPTYTLKEQTDSSNAVKIPYLLSLASIENDNKENNITVISGVIDLDNLILSDNIKSLSLDELIKSKTQKEGEARAKIESELNKEVQESEDIGKKGNKTSEKTRKAKNSTDVSTKGKKGLKEPKNTKETLF